MTSPGKAAQAPRTAGPGDQASVTGNRQNRNFVDVEELTRRVYTLLQEDLRLELARREGRA